MDRLDRPDGCDGHLLLLAHGGGLLLELQGVLGGGLLRDAHDVDVVVGGAGGGGLMRGRGVVYDTLDGVADRYRRVHRARVDINLLGRCLLPGRCWGGKSMTKKWCRGRLDVGGRGGVLLPDGLALDVLMVDDLGLGLLGGRVGGGSLGRLGSLLVLLRSCLRVEGGEHRNDAAVARGSVHWPWGAVDLVGQIPHHSVPLGIL